MPSIEVVDELLAVFQVRIVTRQVFCRLIISLEADSVSILPVGVLPASNTVDLIFIIIIYRRIQTLIRYIKRCSSFAAFDTVRRLFVFRLLLRGYTA
eukprot:SAG31_NODE_22616_length_521_cov_7.848341_1_plen_96_part_10